ncbi:MAG TPA: hypothetical protein PKI91_08185 [Smithella sp.]|nr:hypothetical protein [Smithella sp.]
MNNSNKKYLSIGTPIAGRRHRAFLQNQRGALLIGIIATIVILSALSGGLLYIFSSSSLNPVSGNFAQRAYMNAEAGINYLKALYRNAQTPAEGKALLQTYENQQTINMPDGGTAKVTVSGMTSNYIPAEGTYVSGSGTTLTLSPTSGSFPDPPGFFRKRNDGTIYRYTGKTSDSGNIILTGVSPGVTGAAGVVFVTNEQITIDSQGTVGLGLWNVNRKISYVWPLSGSKHGVSDPPPSPDNKSVRNDNPSFFNEAVASGFAAFFNTIRLFFGLDPSVTSTQLLQMWFNAGLGLMPSSGCGLLVDSLGLYYQVGNDTDGYAIRVDAATGTYGGGFFLPHNINNTYPQYRNFGEVWSRQGNKLSYDAQTKIKIDDGWFADRYLVGLSVRADSHCWQGWDLVNTPMYGFSFAKGHNYKFRLPTNDDIYIVFWRKFSESNYKLIAYKKVASGEGLGPLTFFEDNMDNGTSKWTTPNSCWMNINNDSSSPSNSWKGTLFYSNPYKLHFSHAMLGPGHMKVLINDTEIASWNDPLVGSVINGAEILIGTDIDIISKDIPGIPGDAVIKFQLQDDSGSWATVGAKWRIDNVWIPGVFPPPEYARTLADPMNNSTNWQQPFDSHWSISNGLMRGSFGGTETGTATITSQHFTLPSSVTDLRNESLTSIPFNTTGLGITDSSEIHLTFRHNLQLYYSYPKGGEAFIEACQGSCSDPSSTNWKVIHKYPKTTGDVSGWEKAGPFTLLSEFVNKTGVQIRFRLTTDRDDKFPIWYIDDVKVATPNKLVDWATLGVRVREKLSPRSNEFEVFYGHPVGNNGTGVNTIPYDVNRAACPRDQNCWLPMSPINTMSSSEDKLTLVTANTADPYANANPWYWWYDDDGDYRNTVDDGITDYSTKDKGTFPTTSPRPTDNDGCVYTLEGGASPYGTLEPSAIIKTSGNNCRTTNSSDPNYTEHANRVEEFGIHVFSDITGGTGITGRTWFTDKQVWITDGSSQYGSGVQR